MNPKVQKTMPIILSVVSSLGVVTTAWLAAKETLKNSDKLKETLSDKKDKKKIAKELLKVYWPVIVSGSVTIASNVTGTIISKKYEASLSATAYMLDKTYRKYKGKVKELLGEENEKKVVESISKDDYEKNKDALPGNGMTEYGDRIYWEEHIGFFSAKPENLAKAAMTSTERIMGVDNYGTCGKETKCWTSFRILLEDAKATIINDNHDVDDISYDYGWHYDYLNEEYFGSMFLHYTEHPVYDENGLILYYKIEFDKEPIFACKYNSKELSGGYDARQIDEYAYDFDQEQLIRNNSEEK